MKFWSVFRERKHEIPNLARPMRGFGLYENYQEQSGAQNLTVFTYICSAEVTRLDNIPRGMIGREIPAQRYAVFTHKGATEQIDNTLRYIWGEWLPKSGYFYNNKPDFELFNDRYRPEQAHSEIDLYIPIENN